MSGAFFVMVLEGGDDCAGAGGHAIVRLDPAMKFPMLLCIGVGIGIGIGIRICMGIGLEGG